ncbi:MAG: PqiC family protein [Candidatus Omnitrophica bacterium]|nr:PqiC family protein [Candidatus Omnitrophota bacterium]
MKKLMIYAIFAFMSAGCISVSGSPNPRFYMLSSVDRDKASPVLNIPASTIIEIGPVTIPPYLDRPQMVTQDKNKMVTFAEFDRWGEPLDSGLERLLVENLTLMLPGASLQMFPSNFAIPLNYQVIISVVQLEGDLSKDLLFITQWSIIDSQNRKMVLTKRSQFTCPIKPHNYSGLAGALSAACVSLSSEIAENLFRVANQQRPQEDTKSQPN